LDLELGETTLLSEAGSVLDLGIELCLRLLQVLERAVVLGFDLLERLARLLLGLYIGDAA
jgi:hypothetical protein